LQKHSNLLKTIGTRWYALRLKWKTWNAAMPKI
jgi:hypothetical protein